MTDIKRLLAMADRIEREKPPGCSVFRSRGHVTMSFGIPHDTLEYLWEHFLDGIFSEPPSQPRVFDSSAWTGR